MQSRNNRAHLSSIATFCLSLFVLHVQLTSGQTSPQNQAVPKGGQTQANKPQATAKSKTSKNVSNKGVNANGASEPTLAPISHDFGALLDSATNEASANELKQMVALVWSDKNHSYVAKVKSIGPSSALVTNPVPADETPVSVLIARAGKPSVSVALPTEATKNWIIPGHYSGITKESVSKDCSGPNPCAFLLTADGETIVGQVTGLQISPSQLSLTFRAPANATPTTLRILDPNLHYPEIPLPAKSAGNQELKTYQQVIAGDFCQKNEKGDCTTDFLKPDNPANPQYPHSASDPKSHIKAAYVAAADGSSQKANVDAIGPKSAAITFSAPASFTPAYLVLESENESYRFDYIPAPAVRTQDLPYESDELSSVCDEREDSPGSKKKVADCEHTPATDLQLQPLTEDNDVGLVAINGHLLVARVKAPEGQEADAITVANINPVYTGKKKIIARRTITPSENENRLNVSMSIMDQVTAQRNYGNRIAKRYLAVTLDIHNPTNQKIQFNKSAMYFDVDYEEAKEKGFSWKGFAQQIGMVSTLGLYQPSVYGAPFVPACRDCKPARVSRFGLEQNVRQAPENYLSVLGSFDYTTAKTDDKLKAIELIGSVLTTIATGGLVADASGAFRSGSTVFASTFLPGVRTVAFDTSFINRLRSNLVAQTLQDTIQVSAKSSASTIVLLPRTGILSFTDAEIPVMIKKVLRVHLIEEVVTPVTEAAIKKNECKVGETKNQIRQALGDPYTVTPIGQGSSFSYSAGPIPTVTFDKDGVVTACGTPRTPTEQLDLAKTLIAAKQVLTDLGLTTNQIQLTDKSTVLADIPGVSKTYHFDKNGDIAAPYTFLFKDITAEANKANETPDKFETFLESKALSDDTKSKIKAAHPKGTAGGPVSYPSPDVDGGSVEVTYKSSGKGKSAVLEVNKDSIKFLGPQPKDTSGSK